MGRTFKYLCILAASTTFCLASDLIFFQPGACNLARPHIQVSDAAAGECATSGNGFCGSLFCNGCAQGNDLYSFNKGGCTGGSYNSCREPGNGAYCCNDLGNKNTCAGQWFQGGAARKRSLTMSHVGGSASKAGSEIAKRDEAPTCDKPTGLGCTKTREPDKMVYTDNEGVQRAIHMPLGTWQAAADHLSTNNFEELNKFPVWGKSLRRVCFVAVSCPL